MSTLLLTACPGDDCAKDEDCDSGETCGYGSTDSNPESRLMCLPTHVKTGDTIGGKWEVDEVSVHGGPLTVTAHKKE